MDPFAFATIVGLLATFQFNRDGQSDLEDFKHWLEENNHSNMVSIIENNQGIQQQLTAFMNQNHEQVMAQLSTLNDLMVSIASRMKGLGGIAVEFGANGGLSEQAISVLRQFVNSRCATMHFSDNHKGDGKGYYVLKDNNGIKGYVNYLEEIFIEDDVNSLVEAGLITKSKVGAYDFMYTITRKAFSSIEAIDN